MEQVAQFGVDVDVAAFLRRVLTGVEKAARQRTIACGVVTSRSPISADTVLLVITRPILIRWVTMPLPACICEPRAWLDESSSYDCDDFVPAPGPRLMSINLRRADTL